MNASKANLINSITLIVLGLWGYLDSSAMTALIPVGMGLTLVAFTGGIKNGNKIIAHIAVLGTLIILIALVGMRLPKSIDQGGIGLYRVIAMIMTSFNCIDILYKKFY